MKNPVLFTALLIGVGTICQTSAPAEDLSANNSKPLKKAAAAAARSVSVYTTWAETGVSATGIASSDFLHNQMSKPASKPVFGESSAPANAPVSAPMVADAPAAAETEVMEEVAIAADPDPAPSAPAAAKPAPRKNSSSSSSSSSRPRSAAPAPSRSYDSSGGKNVVMGGGKEVYIEELLSENPPALFEMSVDAGYQSRYYHFGINRVLNAGFIDPSQPDRTTEPEDTDVFYGGVSGHWNGFGGGVKYVRGTTDIETRTSEIGRLVRTVYEEIVANIHYTFAVLPDGWLNATGGYQAIFFDEETFYNASRFDDFYVTLNNTVNQYIRPSVTYHYLDQDSPPGINDNTIAPGQKFHDGQLLIVQIDGQIGVPQKTGLPFDVVYYAQVGFDDELNVDFGNSPLTNNWDHDWTQVGITVPIFFGPVTVSPNWNYNERTSDVGLPRSEHFWGINVRYDF